MKKILRMWLLLPVLLTTSIQLFAANGYIEGPSTTCAWFPVRYRIVFNAECINPTVAGIGVYNSNTSSGYIVSSTFIERGTLANGQIYEDYSITFGNNFNVFNPGNIDLAINVSCTSGGNPVWVSTKSIVLYPPPAVDIVSPSGSYVFYTYYIGVYVGSITLDATTGGIPPINATYKWTVTGNSFYISGPDDQATVTVGSNTNGNSSGTVTLVVRGLSGCEYVAASRNVMAMYRTFPLAATDDAGRSSTEVPINVYPNPAKNNITVALPPTAGSAQVIRIYDTQMKLIKEQRVNGGNVSQVDVSGLQNGVYFIRYTSDKKIGVKKFVVQR